MLNSSQMCFDFLSGKGKSPLRQVPPFHKASTETTGKSGKSFAVNLLSVG